MADLYYLPVAIDSGTTVTRGGGGYPPVEIPSEIAGNRVYNKRIIRDWRIEDLWEDIFLMLRVPPSDVPIVFSDDCFNPQTHRERIAQIFFEKFSVPRVCLVSQATTSLYATMKSTGIVIDIGEELTRIVPIYDGFPIRHAIQTIDVGGSHLTDYLRALSCERGYSFSNGAQRTRALKQYKETFAYVALDFDRENLVNETSKERTLSSPEFEYPLTFGNERFRCTEPLFDPSMIGISDQKFQQKFYDAIMNCAPQIRTEMLNNVILAGGTSNLPGITARCNREISQLGFPQVHTALAPATSAWIGGTILAQHEKFPAFVSGSDYEEYGPSIISRLYF